MARKLTALLFLFLTLQVMAEKSVHIIVTGGPALRKWEDLRVEKNRHDRWWANFVRASVLHIEAIQKQPNSKRKIIWAVHLDSYKRRADEQQKPLTDWIERLAKKKKVKLVWFNKPKKLIKLINKQKKQSIVGFDYFGHSNRHCLMFDYSSAVSAASNSWLHEKDLIKIKSKPFHPKAICKSWGCFSGESMNKYWQKYLKVPLIGAHGKTDYSLVGQGSMPHINGHWVY